MMSSLYDGDARRCRRCKRRRMDDEPPEVQQYKTCAKCRIIERTKKKSRKPLAEETMRYGMRQFQEQNQNPNFMHDEIFSNEQLLSDMQMHSDAALLMNMGTGVNMPMGQKQPLHQQQYAQPLQQQQQQQQQQYGLYKQPSGQQYSSNTGMSMAPSGAPDASSYSYLYANNAGYPVSGEGVAGTPAGSAGVPGASAGATGPAGAVARPALGGASAGLPMFQSPQLAQQNAAGAIPGSQYANPTSSATAAAIAAAAIKRTDPLLSSAQTLNRLLNHYRQYQQKQQGGDRNRLSAATNCELCNETLDASDSVSVMYRLCRSCYSDPYALPNVYSDFNDFLSAIVQNKDLESVTYISELASYLVEALSNNKTISSEELFRKIMLDSFSLIYIDPLIGLLAPLTFGRSSLNVSEVNNTSPIISKVSLQYHYTLTPPLRINHTAETPSGSTSIDMTFITETNLIIMKKTTRKTTQAYDASLLKSIDAQLKTKGLSLTEDPAKLYELLDVALTKDQFVKDFGNLKRQLTAAVEQSAVATQNGSQTEHPQIESSEAKPSKDISDVSQTAEQSEATQAVETLGSSDAASSEPATELTEFTKATEVSGATQPTEPVDLLNENEETSSGETSNLEEQASAEAAQVDAAELDPAFAS